MDPQEPNPMTKHLLGLVESRQQTEIAKISTMASIASTLVELRDLLKSIEAQLVEQTERMKG